MAFASGTVGIERGATQLLFDHAPKVVNRYQEGGPDRVAAVSVPRSPIVTEYVATTNATQLVIRCELLSASAVATLQTLIEGTGTVAVKLSPSSATTVTCMFGPRERQVIEPIWGHYPENAPAVLTVWRCELTLYRM